MKKNLIIILILAILLASVYLIFFKRSPYSIAKSYLGCKIAKSNHIDTFSEEWLFNGDGYIFLVFSIKKEQIQKIEDCCINQHFKRLPIPVFYTQFLNKELKKYLNPDDSNGYYILVTDSNDYNSYKLAALNITKSKLIISGEEH
jgi:hypothetical protein